MKGLHPTLGLISALLFLSVNTVLPQIQFSPAQESAASQIAVSEPSPQVPWPRFWREYHTSSSWELAWYNGSSWNYRGEWLTVTHTYPALNTCKTTLKLMALEPGEYKISFQIRDSVLNYEGAPWRVILDYFSSRVTFDWDDLQAFSGLIFDWEIREEQFCYTIQKTITVPRTIVLDPKTIVDQDSVLATRYEGQRKTFRNPRGNRFFYALFYYKDTSSSLYQLRFYSSPNIAIWIYEELLHNFTSDIYESADSWIYDDGSQLLVYFAYTDTNGNLYYRNATISDENEISLGAEQTLFSGDVDNEIRYPQISLAQDGYLHISYERIGGGSINYYYVDGFDSTYVEWDETGSSPYLDAIDSAYISTSVAGNYEGWFTFWDPFKEGMAEIQLYCYGDGDDQVSVYLHNGYGTSFLGDVTPDVSYGWKTLDASELLTTLDMLQDAKIYLVKKTSKRANLIYVDCARLSLQAPYQVRLLSSTVSYSPNASQWSSEYTLFQTGSLFEVYPKSAPFSSDRDLLVLWYYKWYIEVAPDVWDPRYGLGGIEIDWNGSVHMKGQNETEKSLGAFWNRHISLICDEKNNQGQFLYGVSGGVLDWGKWILGSGFDFTGTYSVTIYGHSYSLVVDLSSNPDMLYAFCTSSADPEDEFQLKSCNPNFNEAWDIEATVSDNEGVEDIAYFSSQYRNSLTSMVLLYTRQNSGAVRFYHKAITYHWSLIIYWNPGKENLYLNGSWKGWPNGTEYDWEENDVVNMTVTSLSGYEFLNYTYDGSTSTDNPFLLLMDQNYTVWAYFGPLYTVSFYFYTGGSLLVNSTNRENGTSTQYSPGTILNITGSPSYQYLFKNHTYDSSLSTENPFLLTVDKNYTVHTYFRKIYDCSWIGLNNTYAGFSTKLSTKWDELYSAEGLSHHRLCTNNTGSWLNGSWSSSWIDTYWAEAVITLNSTPEISVAFRFYVNSSSGNLYNSTICFLRTSYYVNQTIPSQGPFFHSYQLDYGAALILRAPERVEASLPQYLGNTVPISVKLQVLNRMSRTRNLALIYNVSGPGGELILNGSLVEDLDPNSQEELTLAWEVPLGKKEAPKNYTISIMVFSRGRLLGDPIYHVITVAQSSWAPLYVLALLGLVCVVGGIGYGTYKLLRRGSS